LKNIIFYFPFKEHSGVPALFARVSRYISENTEGNTVWVVDYENGALQYLTRNCLVRHLIYEEDVLLTFPCNSVVIFQSLLPMRFPENIRLGEATRVLFWNLHPYNLVPFLLPLNGIRYLITNNILLYNILCFFARGHLKKMRDWVLNCIKYEALFFMDYDNYFVTNKYLSLNLKPNYIPICGDADSDLVMSQNKLPELGHLRICWIGRFVDFKYYILKYFIKELDKIAINRKLKVEFTFIGDGPYLNKVREIGVSDYVDTNFIGALQLDSLNDYLKRDKPVLVVAMGTSALEAAKLSIPVVLLDITNKNIKNNYVFRLLGDSIIPDVGHEVCSRDFKEDNDSLDVIVARVFSEYTIICRDSFNYYDKFHNISSVVAKIMISIDGAGIPGEYFNNRKNIGRSYFANKLFKFRNYVRRKFKYQFSILS
jgi:hypothetical protein